MGKSMLQDRVVLEVFGKEECTPAYVAELLRQVADQIELDGRRGGSYDDEYIGEPDKEEPYDIYWEHECKEYGGLRMGYRSLIRDAYYGAKQTFEVCCVEREDLENRDFDTSKLTNEDMERIAAKAGDLILEGCDYWTGVVEAARYWNVPIKEED
jgi:hypothetical protein